ncbi:hypothetical protein N9P74_00300 [bacterium]|nr:hypothetical protein [bacterium]MDB0072694.1 hypothetical protein [bacterium]MDB4235126.1 hypothetical protein [bacterium]MDB4277865.1 hypothetical protein [Gammaproteobacteria bacterium]MDB4351859.1 hypothetical protein [Porticoccaceae bacterium]
MGRIARKKTDKIFNGSKLIVPGQGISTSRVDKNNTDINNNRPNNSNKPDKGKK